MKSSVTKVLSLYLEARIRIWIQIRIKVKGRIRIHIKVTSFDLQMTKQNVWNMSLFEPFLRF
jgi:hypothetical protein